MDEVPTQAPDFILSLSIASKCDLTANLSLALRAARVDALCPSEAAVRALNLCGGPTPLAMGFAPPAARQRSARRSSEVSRPTFAVSPLFERVKSFPYEGKGDHVSGG